MIMANFGWSGLCWKRYHEFGNPTLGKVLQVNLLFVALWFVKNETFYRAARAIADDNYDWVKNVRKARERGYRKGMAQGKGYHKSVADSYKRLYEEVLAKNSDMSRDNYGLKIAIKALGDGHGN